MNKEEFNKLIEIENKLQILFENKFIKPSLIFYFYKNKEERERRINKRDKELNKEIGKQVVFR